MVGETLEGKPKGNNYIVYRGDKTRDFDLKLQMKIEKGGGGGIQYRSVTGVPWTRAQPARPAAVRSEVHDDRPAGGLLVPGDVRRPRRYTGQWYSENTMQGILAYRGQVTQALPGQTNRLVATIGDKQALGGYVKVNEWNDYEIIARGGVMMHIMNGQLMAVFIDDNKDSVNNQPGLIGFEIESQPCKISVRDIWLRKFDSYRLCCEAGVSLAEQRTNGLRAYALFGNERMICVAGTERPCASREPDRAKLSCNFAHLPNPFAKVAIHGGTSPVRAVDRQRIGRERHPVVVENARCQSSLR